MVQPPSSNRRRLLAASVSAVGLGLTGRELMAQGAQGQKSQQTASAVKYPIIVLNSRDADVSLIHPETYAVIGKVATGKEPHHLYPTPDNRHVVIGNAVSNSLTFLDPVSGNLEFSVKGVDDPYHLGFSPDQNFFMTCANRMNHVDVYRRHGNADKMQLQGLARFDLAKTPSHLVFSGDSKTAFVTLQESHELVAIDLMRLVVLWRYRVGKLPAGVAISPDSKLLFVGIMGEDCVEVVEPRLGNSVGPRTVIKIPTGEGAHAFRNHGNKRHLWVSNRMANTVSMLDMSTLKIETEIKVPGGPDCMEVHSSGKQLWITQRWTRSVSMIDLDQGRVAKTILVGRSPHGVYLHDRAGLV